MYIYLITNKTNGKHYIGQTSDYIRRYQQHKSNAQQLIDQKIRQYGIQNFIFEVLETNLTQDEANQKEIEYIQKYNCLIPNGYNIHSGGRNNSIGEENHNAILTEQEAQ